jgi:hypothetical protein
MSSNASHEAMSDAEALELVAELEMNRWERWHFEREAQLDLELLLAAPAALRPDPVLKRRLDFERFYADRFEREARVEIELMTRRMSR